MVAPPGPNPTARVALQFEYRPIGAGRFGFCCAVLDLASVDRLPIVISALGIPAGQAWELRTSGLWTEQVCEQPNLHWSYGLEAFALAIDEPDELLRRGHGHRVPLGWELDFVSDEAPTGDGHEVTQAGMVEGILLTADGETPIEGPALRTYWLDRDPPAFSHVSELVHRSEPGEKPADPAAILPTGSGPWVVL